MTNSHVHMCQPCANKIRKHLKCNISTVYPKKYAHGFCFAVLCCGYTLTDFPISIRLTSLALWQSNDCPSASKATLMNMDKYFMWIHYERLHNHNKAKHNKTVCIFLGIYCMMKDHAHIPIQSQPYWYAFHRSLGMMNRHDKHMTNIWQTYPYAFQRARRTFICLCQPWTNINMHFNEW